MPVPPKDPNRADVARMIETLRNRHAMWEENVLVGGLIQDTKNIFLNIELTPAYTKVLTQTDKEFMRAFGLKIGHQARV
jgi:hypothetical protein